MKRYLNLYLYFLRFSFSKAIHFKLDFYFRVIMDVVWYIMKILFFKVLFLHTTLVGNWTNEEFTVFTCGYLLMDAIYMTFFANNLWWFPIYINRGDLDYYLTRPVSTLFFLTLREFAANSFMNLILAIGLFYWSLHLYPYPIHWDKLIIYIFCIFNGAYLYALFYLLAMLPVFWTNSPRGLAELYWKVGQLAEKPDAIYRGWFRKVLIGVFPMALIASYPARIFLNPYDPKILLTIITMTILSSLIVWVCWKKALRNYTSASS